MSRVMLVMVVFLMGCATVTDRWQVVGAAPSWVETECAELVRDLDRGDVGGHMTTTVLVGWAVGVVPTVAIAPGDLRAGATGSAIGAGLGALIGWSAAEARQREREDALYVPCLSARGYDVVPQDLLPAGAESEETR